MEMLVGLVFQLTNTFVSKQYKLQFEHKKQQQPAKPIRQLMMQARTQPFVYLNNDMSDFLPQVMVKLEEFKEAAMQEIQIEEEMEEVKHEMKEKEQKGSLRKARGEKKGSASEDKRDDAGKEGKELRDRSKHAVWMLLMMEKNLLNFLEEFKK